MPTLSQNTKKALKTDNISDISFILFETGWIKVLNESAIKILLYFSYLRNKGQSLIGKYSSIIDITNLSRNSVSVGLAELEALGFLKHIKTLPNKIKIYDLNNNIHYLNESWIKFFKDKFFKELCINLILGIGVSDKKIEESKNLILNENNIFIKKTLEKLLYLYSENKLVSINNLLEEEKIFMDEDLFTPEELGMGEENWKSILNDEEKNNKYLIDTIEHYAILVNYPTRKDVDLIKKALEICFPFQIRNAITSLKNNPKLGSKFKSFSYLYPQLVKGRYQTRAKNNLKTNFKVEKATHKKPNNQTDMGYKKSTCTNEEMIKLIDEAAKNGKSFDFELLKRK